MRWTKPLFICVIGIAYNQGSGSRVAGMADGSAGFLIGEGEIMIVQRFAFVLTTSTLLLAPWGSGTVLADAVARKEIRDERAAIKVLRPLGARLQLVDGRVVSADLTQVKKTAAAVAQLPRLKRLAQLNLSGCKLTATEMDAVSKLEKLELLNLSKTGVDDASLARLSSRTLRILNLSGNPVSDAGMAALRANLPKLYSLDLSTTNCGDTGLAELTQLAELKILNLGGSEVTDKGLEAFRRNPPKWQSLDLSGTKITNAGMPDIVRLKDLTTLHLSGTAVTDAGIEPLKQMPQLNTLVAKITPITDAGRMFLNSEQMRLRNDQRRGLLLDPKRLITAVWSTGRPGLAPNEDKIVTTFAFGPPRPQTQVGPLMLNTTRFTILFADIVEWRGRTDTNLLALYNKLLAGQPKGETRAVDRETYKFVHTIHFDHLDIIVTAPGQMYRLQVFDEGNTLVVNGRHKFDLRAKKKYIIVRRDGSAREL